MMENAKILHATFLYKVSSCIVVFIHNKYIINLHSNNLYKTLYLNSNKFPCTIPKTFLNFSTTN